ncbi:MAG: hypothetical protein IJ722_00900 [Alloprevotella sp.]|nr:hypothetical protein [Alloprevotella sp.]
MKDDKTFDGALCAGVGTADAAGAAPAEGKKKYVSPTMQVIPLGPQRLLATSGAALQILITSGVDYYQLCIPAEGYHIGPATCEEIVGGKKAEFAARYAHLFYYPDTGYPWPCNFRLHPSYTTNESIYTYEISDWGDFELDESCTWLDYGDSFVTTGKYKGRKATFTITHI